MVNKPWLGFCFKSFFEIRGIKQNYFSLNIGCTIRQKLKKKQSDSD